MSVINVKVQFLRKGCECCGEAYDTLEAWLANPRHVYVGRGIPWVKGAAQSPFANPYTIKVAGSREAAINMFERLVITDLAFQKKIRAELAGKTLGCWCAPEACHADILVRLANKDNS